MHCDHIHHTNIARLHVTIGFDNLKMLRCSNRWHSHTWLAGSLAGGYHRNYYSMDFLREGSAPDEDKHQHGHRFMIMDNDGELRWTVTMEVDSATLHGEITDDRYGDLLITQRAPGWFAWSFLRCFSSTRVMFHPEISRFVAFFRDEAVFGYNSKQIALEGSMILTKLMFCSVYLKQHLNLTFIAKIRWLPMVVGTSHSYFMARSPFINIFSPTLVEWSTSRAGAGCLSRAHSMESGPRIRWNHLLSYPMPIPSTSKCPGPNLRNRTHMNLRPE